MGLTHILTVLPEHGEAAGVLELELGVQEEKLPLRLRMVVAFATQSHALGRAICRANVVGNIRGPVLMACHLAFPGEHVPKALI